MKKTLKIFLIICSLFYFAACNNSYDIMIDSFNRKYFLSEQMSAEAYSVKDPDFNPAEMLLAAYTIPEGMYLSLEAPEGGDSYSWVFIKDDGTPYDPPLSEERFLYYETPGPFKVREENDLVLTVTVTDDKGNVTEYIDKSVIIIQKSAKD